MRCLGRQLLMYVESVFKVGQFGTELIHHLDTSMKTKMNSSRMTASTNFHVINVANTKPVTQRHDMVSGSLALLLCCCKVSGGSRAAAPRGNKVLQDGKKFRPSVRLSVHPSICPSVCESVCPFFPLSLRPSNHGPAKGF